MNKKKLELELDELKAAVTEIARALVLLHGENEKLIHDMRSTPMTNLTNLVANEATSSGQKLSCYG